MIGLARPQILENVRRLDLARIGLVGEVDRLEDGERVEGGHFRIIRISAGEPLHRRLVGLGARGMAALTVVAIIDLECVHEAALALGLRLYRFGLAQESAAFAQRVCVEPARERIAARAHGCAPPGHGAVAIGFGDRRERVDCVIERVQPRHRRLERFGDAPRAGGRE